MPSVLLTLLVAVDAADDYSNVSGCVQWTVTW